MGGFHLIDLAIVVVVGLALFGTKNLQKMARDLGKGTAKLKDAKDSLMSELPMEEINQIRGHISSVPSVPTSPQGVVKMLLTPEKKTAEKATEVPQVQQEKVAAKEQA